MNLSNIKNAISVKTDIFKTNVQAHSPELLIGAGVICAVTSTVLACKATLKAKDILEERKTTIKALEEVKATTEPEVYSEEDHQKDITMVNLQTGLKVVGLYLPAVSVGILGMGCLVKSNNIHRKHETELAAAYASLDGLFKKYRDRVKETYGEEIDQKLRFGTHTEKIESEYTDENGNTKKKKESVEVIDVLDDEDFSAFFDEASKFWDGDPKYNKALVLETQAKWNRILIERAKMNFHGYGYVRLTEIYTDLNILMDKSTEMRWKDVGWVFNFDDPDLSHTQIDFGLTDKYRACNRTLSGYEPVILISPNVQGNIFELMK